MRQAVYRDFDAEALESRYNPRLTVADVDGVVADWASRNSPMAPPPAHDLPMAVAVGGAEPDEFRRQSREFREPWAGRLGAIDYIETEGENHFTVIDGLVDPDGPITRALFGHMGL